MLCVVCDDFNVLIVDADTRRIVRTFGGHRNRVTDTVCYMYATDVIVGSTSGYAFRCRRLVVMVAGWCPVLWIVASGHGIYPQEGMLGNPMLLYCS